MPDPAPTKECDLIMKGGITSGVVYPAAVLRIAKDYRFRQIGGTSAGAIAAALTAAAEHGRASSGFERLAEVQAELRTSLADRLQPSPEVRPLYRVLHAVVAERSLRRGVGAALASQPLGTAITIASTAAVAFLGYRTAGALVAALVGVIALGVFAALFLAWPLARQLGRLERLDFGLCPGTTQRPAAGATAGLIDWLADRIDRAAGLDPGDGSSRGPLTFGDLWAGPDGSGSAVAPRVSLHMMTTNVSMRRPNALPTLDTRNYAFDPVELARVLPERIVAHMCQEPLDGHPGYFRFPEPARLPVVTAVRMSLSFPFLIAAVPLYRVNHAEGRTLERLLFSDGGLSSNFPIHFFDAMLPSRPTFGIALDALDPQSSQTLRIYLPMSAGAGLHQRASTVRAVGQFVLGMLEAAKDWQDQLQLRLPGYRERAVRIYLDESKEGGLHLAMPRPVIDGLAQLGHRAGSLLVGAPDPAFAEDRDAFDFEDHRWRRFLVAFAALEEALEEASIRWTDPDPERNFADFVRRVKDAPPSYVASPQSWRDDVFRRFDDLMQAVTQWDGPLRHQEGAIPKPRFRLRITPELTGRTPRTEVGEETV